MSTLTDDTEPYSLKKQIPYVLIKTECTFFPGELDDITCMLERFLFTEAKHDIIWRELLDALVVGNLVITNGIHNNIERTRVCPTLLGVSKNSVTFYESKYQHFSVRIDTEVPKRFHFYVEEYNSRIINNLMKLDQQELKIQKRYYIIGASSALLDSPRDSCKMVLPYYGHRGIRDSSQATVSKLFMYKNKMGRINKVDGRQLNAKLLRKHRSSRSRSHSYDSQGLPGKVISEEPCKSTQLQQTSINNLKRSISDVREEEEDDGFTEVKKRK
jgi:hypothetical protein